MGDCYQLPNVVLILLGMLVCLARSSAKEGPSLSEILHSKTSFEIKQDALERAAAALVAKVRKKGEAFEVRLVGKDLQIEGITRNQSIRDVSYKEKTVAEILTALVLKANPNTAIKDPDDPRLKLIWTIAPDPDNPDREIVLITTRQAAKTRGDKIPVVFTRSQ